MAFLPTIFSFEFSEWYQETFKRISLFETSSHCGGMRNLTVVTSKKDDLLAIVYGCATATRKDNENQGVGVV